jgi:hypothetical protein
MMTTATVENARNAHALTILERSVCLTLSCHYLGNNRKVELQDLVEAANGPREESETGHEQIAIDEQQFYATKRLIPSEELRPVMRVFGVAKSKLRVKAISAHQIFGERTYLIPWDLVTETDADLEACQAELKAQAHDLAFRRYQPAVEKQRTALGPLFREGDYLTPALVEAAFSIDWDYVSFKAPDKLETVSRALAMRADKKYSDKLSQAYDEVLVGLRASALRVMKDLARRLTPGEDGKPKAMRGTALRDLQEFMAYLPQRNMTDDTALADALARVSALAEGLNVETLRSNEATRQAFRQVVDEASETLAGLVEEVGRRAISFGAL